MTFTAAAAVSGRDVTVTLSGAPAYTAYTVTAVTTTRSYLVRGTIAGSAITDHYPPYGQPITYQVRVLSSGTWYQADTSPVTVTYALATFTETNTDTSIDVDVISQPPNAYQARSVVFDVIGRAEPVVAQYPAGLRTGTLRVRSADIAGRDAVRVMLAAGYPIVLRSPFHATTDDVTFLPLSFQEAPAVDGSSARVWDIAYQAVSVETVAYAAVTNTYALLAGYTARYPTYTVLGSGLYVESYSALVVGL